jgi:hypothetical protein
MNKQKHEELIAFVHKKVRVIADNLYFIVLQLLLYNKTLKGGVHYGEPFLLL